MNKFAISPDDCLILKAFRDSNSLREAATLLNCDPAGLARRVQNISTQYGYLQKINNRWQVTPTGLSLVAWVEESIQSQKNLVLSRQSIRLASTAWFSENQIIPHLPRLKNLLEVDATFSVSTPSRGFEHALTSGLVDFVIVCHPPENPEIEHRQLNLEKWIIILPSSWKKDFKTADLTGLLAKKPFIRHSALNEDLFLPEINIKDSGYSMDHLIGVRSAVINGLGWSVVPRFSVAREIQNDSVIELDYEVQIKDRKVCVWWLRNNSRSKKLSGKISQWVKDITR